MEIIPVISRCFNFVDLFSGNATQDFVNKTQNLGGITIGEAGIHWQLENVEKFDKEGNYSRVLYHQYITSPASDEFKPGHYADCQVTSYGGRDCSELDPSSSNRTAPLIQWYGFSCWTKSKESCGTLPYSITSCSVQPRKDKNQDGTCWVFAKTGAAAPVYPSSQTTMGAFLGAVLAIWMILQSRIISSQSLLFFLIFLLTESCP
jgi:hypothetical protein